MRLRPRVEVFCFRGPKVLAGYRGYVLFPGGGIDPRENAVEAAKREFAEEASRRLTNCTIAHPQTTQKWSDKYKSDGKEWKKNFDGGVTTWVTGSSSDEIQALKHRDFETSLEWKPVDEVIEKLKSLKGTDWANDNLTRIAILTAHNKMRLDRVKRAAIITPRFDEYPVLSWKDTP